MGTKRRTSAEEIIERVKNKGYVDHVEEERLADLARERERERLQMEMFDDPYMNWSGQR